MDPDPPSPPPIRGRGDPSSPPDPPPRPPPVIAPENASFVTLRASGSVSLASLNPFLIKKVIDGCAGPVDQVKKLASGDLLVKTSHTSQVKDLLKLRKFHCYDVTAQIPVSMNSCKGVTYCRDFLYMTVQDIVGEMADQYVVDARFITRYTNGERVKTPTVVLTFGMATLPDAVHVGYERCPVRVYIPNPLRCFNCQQFRHTKEACRSPQVVCERCGGRGHESVGCTETAKCVNCAGAHSSSSRDCPRWKIEKEVCTVKATSGVSYFEARKKVEELHATPRPNVSYASAANSRPQMHSVGTQTCSVSTQTDSLPPDTPVQSQPPLTQSSSSTTTTVSSAPTGSAASSDSASTSVSDSPPPSTSSPPAASSSDSTSASVRDKSSYSHAAASSPSPHGGKNGKSDLNKVNLTPLSRQSYTHVIPSPAPSREASRPRPGGSMEKMEVTGSKPRRRSPGSHQSKQKKKSKHTGPPVHS